MVNYPVESTQLLELVNLGYVSFKHINIVYTNKYIYIALYCLLQVVSSFVPMFVTFLRAEVTSIWRIKWSLVKKLVNNSTLFRNQLRSNVLTSCQVFTVQKFNMETAKNQRRLCVKGFRTWEFPHGFSGSKFVSTEGEWENHTLVPWCLVLLGLFGFDFFCNFHLLRCLWCFCCFGHKVSKLRFQALHNLASIHILPRSIGPWAHFYGCNSGDSNGNWITTLSLKLTNIATENRGPLEARRFLLESTIFRCVCC